MEEDFSEADAGAVLKLARKHVRSRTRSSTYAEHADRFSQALLGEPLGVDSEYYKALGMDFTVIDFYYDSLVAEGEGAVSLLKQLTQELQKMADLSHAGSALPDLRTRLALATCSFLDVASGVLAAITILGHASLSRRT